MLEEVVRRITLLERKQERLILPESSGQVGSAIASYLALPGLVGFWPMSSVKRSTGDVYDISGQGRTLTYNGNPTFNYTSVGFPYIALDGTGDYLERIDETDLDVQGTETIFAAATRGLTVGGWFYPTTANAEYAFAKWMNTGNQRSYRIYKVTGLWYASVSVDGTNIKTVTGGSAVPNAWYFLAERFVPSTSLDLWCNSTKYTQAAAIPASIFSGAAKLEVGRDESGANGPFTGSASLCFLCADMLPDALIGSLFEQTRGFFGV